MGQRDAGNGGEGDESLDVAVVFQEEVDQCVNEAARLSAALSPDQALEAWIKYYAKFIVTKRGLAAALHYRDPAFNSLPGYFQTRLGPVLKLLLDEAAAIGAVREGVEPLDLLGAVAKLCIPPADSDDTSRGERMVSLLIDGMRYRAAESPPKGN